MHNGFKHTLIILVPLLIVFAALPGVYQNHLLLFNFVIFLILAQGVNIIYGFTGYLPFGYVGFFGAGAYGFALAVMHLHMPALGAMVCAGVAALTGSSRIACSASPKRELRSHTTNPKVAAMMTMAT